MLLNKWLSSVADVGREMLSRKNDSRKSKTLEEYCADLMSNKGEALGTAIANEVATSYQTADDEKKLSFFQHLLEQYSPDPEAVITLANAYRDEPSYDSYVALSEAIEAPRQKLFKRMNMASKGTEVIVALRKDFLRLVKDHPELKPIDFDLLHLLKSWFNRGFLTLAEIDWNTPAVILEKLIEYEAVHSMSGWDDLKKRLGPNRRCYAFFHASLPNEPLIFVEVALVNGLASAIDPLIDPNPYDNSHNDVLDTAIFYSISNCQSGLAGISFGNFLIKQVVMELKKECPQLTQFATLSPIPTFRRWLSHELDNLESRFINSSSRTTLSLMNEVNWPASQEHCDLLQPILMKLCAQYLINAKKSGKPYDPVTRFHLGNGARIERLNWLGDKSEKGLMQSAGLLVNYFYDIDEVEKNHEAFMNKGTISHSKDLAKLLQVS
ncbi:malonyl-CoA decarboxylase [Marinomonas sp. 15G1-11]|uniref:Malonyl-CoA decarboxylase n=1 Tax=Marinomonas phaeophyticola TaxID=3004091 RepID=A0ABT4JQH8_9GAMM|nr:malonyl-CoA decarboxylase [Marinomonas sp. 15G1-11]MCZ2720640.1 malonyl-CoA decarboxylase [Marinomonas sp. 15G1-11]